MDLLLPLNGAVLRVEPLDQNPDGLLRVLRSSDAPIEAWRIAAEHLLVYGGPQGPHHFEAVLTEATEREEGRRKGPNESFGHIQALCCLAELKLQQAAAERGLQQRTLLLSACTNFCNKARHLDIQEQLPELVLGAAALVRVRGRAGLAVVLRCAATKHAELHAPCSPSRVPSPPPCYRAIATPASSTL
jgi:hypothetical protein